MALITDLPAASGLSNTDLLVIDTGSATQKIQAKDAGASASNAGFMTTGAQSFAGVKIFENGSGIRSSGAYTNIDMFGAGDSTRDMSITGVTDTGYNCLYFNEYHRTNGTTQPYVDSFFLPASGEDNANHSYDILTTKTIYTKSDTSSISGVQLRRWGNIVTIFLCGASVNSSGSIGTIPADYRPSAYLYANCVHTAAGGVVRPAQITIESTGTTVISAYNGSNNYGTATNGYVNGTITFVVN